MIKTPIEIVSIQTALPVKILKIQELSFACVDLNLYLDTHPDDACAVNMYNSFTKQLNEAIRNYECKYGPLTKDNAAGECEWKWINNPWPWERMV